ncbi:MAG: class II glutamine amidotransferase [Candidatus Methanofastidiosia archaeon]
MCRLFGIIGEFSSSYYLKEFRELALSGKGKKKKGHRHGWGIGYYLLKKACVAKEPIDASKSEVLDFFCTKDLKTKILLSHLRLASQGEKIYENTHPFSKENCIFSHNGSILNFTSHGTDSELFFLTILDNRIRTLKASIKKTILKIRRDFHFTSLNFILSDGKRLYAFREFFENEDYYTLKYLDQPGHLAVCSESLGEEEWIDLENRELLVCDLRLKMKKYRI